MIYPSETLAFKKSEILKCLKAYLPDFDLEVPLNVLKEDIEPTFLNIKNNFNDYRKFLFNAPLLSLWEAACIACDVDSSELRLNTEYDLREKFPELNSAVDFLESSIKAGLLSYQNNEIEKQELQVFFAEQNIFIDGFNINREKNETYEDQGKEIERLKEELRILKESKSNSLENDSASFSTVTVGHASIEHYKKHRDELLIEVEKLKSELLEKEEQIKELELSKTDNNTDLLTLIFDENANERYAPDLVSAIRLWEHLYITNPSDDSHTNRANGWIRKNTGYDGLEKDSSSSRIREIASPFKEWGGKRNKKYNK